MSHHKKAQVWVETVVYTLIGLSLIAVVLTMITPRINEQKDRAVIEQTISSLNALNAKISEVLSAPGNVRIVEMQMKRGELNFDTVNDQIYFELTDSRSLYSEPGVEVQFGRINITTTEGTKEHTVKLLISYQFDLRFNSQTSGTEKIPSAAAPYRFEIENLGNSVVNIRLLS